MKAVGKITATSKEKKSKKSKKKQESEKSLKREDKPESIFKKGPSASIGDSKSTKTIKARPNKISKTHKHTESNNTHLSSLNNSSFLRTTTK